MFKPLLQREEIGARIVAFVVLGSRGRILHKILGGIIEAPGQPIFLNALGQGATVVFAIAIIFLMTAAKHLQKSCRRPIAAHDVATRRRLRLEHGARLPSGTPNLSSHEKTLPFLGDLFRQWHVAAILILGQRLWQASIVGRSVRFLHPTSLESARRI